MRRLTLLVIGGLLTSCGPIHFNFHLHEVGPSLAVTGSTVLLRVFVNTPGGDQRSLALPSRPVCSVNGPSGRAVACSFSDWSVPNIDEDNGTALLSFTPVEPGWHDASATLPEGGFVSWRFDVVAHFQGEELVHLDRGCSWVERLAADAWLCDDVVLRSGAPPQFLGGELATVGGPSVWTWNAGELRRFRDSGSGPLRAEPDARLDTGFFRVQVLFATESEALLVHAGGLLRVELDSSGALRAVARVDRAFAPGLVVTRIGDLVMTGEAAAAEVEVCTWLLSSGTISSGLCRRYPGVALGRGEGGLLLQSEGRLRRVTPSLDDGLEADLPPSLGGQLHLGGRGLVVFALGIIPRVDGSTLRFESYSGLSGADEGFVWGTSRTATTVSRR